MTENLVKPATVQPQSSGKPVVFSTPRWGYSSVAPVQHSWRLSGAAERQRAAQDTDLCAG